MLVGSSLDKFSCVFSMFCHTGCVNMKISHTEGVAAAAAETNSRGLMLAFVSKVF